MSDIKNSTQNILILYSQAYSLENVLEILITSVSEPLSHSVSLSVASMLTNLTYSLPIATSFSRHEIDICSTTWNCKHKDGVFRTKKNKAYKHENFVFKVLVSCGTRPVNAISRLLLLRNKVAKYISRMPYIHAAKSANPTRATRD